MSESVLKRLASFQDRRDQVLNIALAEELVVTKNRGQISELITLMHDGPIPARGDAMKVLYEIGARSPELIAEYLDEFLMLLSSPNNRLIWGAMTAISTIAVFHKQKLFEERMRILDAAERSSVIAKDHAVKILVTLADIDARRVVIGSVMIDVLRDCALNQLPTYAAAAAAGILPVDQRKDFIEVLEKRLKGPMPQSKRKKLETMIAQIAYV